MLLVFVGVIYQKIPQPVSNTFSPFSYDIGDPVVFDGITYTVTGWNETEGSETKIVTVSLEAENVGKEPIMLTNDMVRLMDGAERQYEYRTLGSNFSGTMNPGLKIQGKVVFEVPLDADGFFVALREDVFDFGGADYQYVELSD